MAYTKTNWKEYTGTGAQKATWMNNMETQYDEVVSYYTTTLHDDSYYTSAYCGGFFFSPIKHGTGSGFVAETLDGYTAAAILSAQVATGTVAIWGSSQASIPAGWHLCDGRDANTPDLRGRFPVAAGSSYVRGATGGSATVSSTAATVTIATHAITTSEMGAHTHSGIIDRNDSVMQGNTSYSYSNGADVAQTRTTGPAGGGTAHGHPGSSVAAGQGTTGNNLPNYKAYCYIIKE